MDRKPIILSGGKLSELPEEDDLQDKNHQAGWYNVPADSTVRVKQNKIALVSLYEEHDGYIDHDGFIDGGY